MNQEFWMWARIQPLSLFFLFSFISRNKVNMWTLPSFSIPLVLWQDRPITRLVTFDSVSLSGCSACLTKRLVSRHLAAHISDFISSFFFFYILFCSPTDVQRIARQSFSPIHSFEIIQIEKNDQKMVQKTNDAKCLSLVFCVRIFQQIAMLWGI